MKPLRLHFRWNREWTPIDANDEKENHRLFSSIYCLNTGRQGILIVPILVTSLLLSSVTEVRGAGLLIADGGLGGVLEIQEHTVNITINNGVAVTEVTQVFHNTENRQVEALYTFPVPQGASVSNFSMWINGKEMVGEVLEKTKAREIYENYKQRRQDPGLLEQPDYKTFEMRIFPIAAGGDQKVQVTYYQELEWDGDWATYVYPLATVTRPGLDSRTRGKFALSLEAKSEIPIVSMESPSHDKEFVISQHNDSYYQASLEASGGDLSRDMVLAYQMSRPRTGLDLIASKVSGEDGYFLLTLTAGEELAQKDTGMDYVFILDISGSMAQDGKLHLSRNSIAAFVEELAAEDRFELIAFNVQARPLFKELRPGNAEAKAHAASFLNSQDARGGTVLHPAVAAAYRYADSDRPLNVVILSDGMTEQKERRSLFEMIQGRPRNSRVFCIGVGNEVNLPMLEQLAQEAGGLAAFISRGDNFARQAKAFRRKLLRPVATDLQISFDDSRVYDVEPSRLPNLYHGMPVRLYGRYPKGGPTTVSLKADVTGNELKKSVVLEFPGQDAGNPEIERMWAWHRIDRLLKDGDLTGSRDRVASEVVRLGEAFSIVSEYTSFIVLENDAEYQRWHIERRNLLRTERERRSREALNVQLEAIRLKAAADIGPTVSLPQPASPIPALIHPQTPAVQSAAPQPIASPTQNPRSRSRGLDLDLSRIGGGGAIDPLAGGLALGLAALALASRRRKN